MQMLRKKEIKQINNNNYSFFFFFGLQIVQDADEYRNK